MKKMISASLVAAMALTTANAASGLEARLATLEAQLATVKAELKKQNTKVNTIKAHDAGDNIKWGADLRTAIDNIDYTMADGSKAGKEDLMSLRLWLNMEYAVDANNIFKGQLAMNKAFGANFALPSQFNSMDWTANEALTDNTLHVRQAYWLYMGENFLGADVPWTFSVGRRPSTNGFLANLRDDDNAQSPLGHIINLEFDGLSSKLDLSKVTGIPGMSVKLCMGQGSTNANPLLGTGTPSANTTGVEDIKLAGFIVEPYNDGQIVTKATWFRAYDVPDLVMTNTLLPERMSNVADTYLNQMYTMTQYGDMTGGAFSVLIDGLAEDGILADTKVFASYAYSQTHPNAGQYMLGFNAGNFGTYGADQGESKTGNSYWVGTQFPLLGGHLGLEYNHGSKYWRPFTYAEDTMAGSKLAARGDAKEIYYTYNFSDALSGQLRYTQIDYDYTGSNGFFGPYGTPFTIAEAAMFASMPGYEEFNAIEKARDIRAYIRYRF